MSKRRERVTHTLAAFCAVDQNQVLTEEHDDGTVIATASSFTIQVGPGGGEVRALYGSLGQDAVTAIQYVDGSSRAELLRALGTAEDIAMRMDSTRWALKALGLDVHPSRTTARMTVMRDGETLGHVTACGDGIRISGWTVG